jgi:fructosamine-3-kinase
MYVPLDLWVKLREEAAKRGTSVNQIVVEALRFYLEARPFFSDRRVLEALRALASEGGTSGELERFAKALSEVLTKEKKVKSGG